MIYSMTPPTKFYHGIQINVIMWPKFRNSGKIIITFIL